MVHSHQTVLTLKTKKKVHVDRVVDGDTFVATNSEGKKLKLDL